MLLPIAHRSLHHRVSAALATVVLTVALLAGPGQPAVAAAPSDALPAYSYHGDGCYFDHHPVLADAQAVRRYVPSRFQIVFSDTVKCWPMAFRTAG